jgi:hypothetical protein
MKKKNGFSGVWLSDSGCQFRIVHILGRRYFYRYSYTSGPERYRKSGFAKLVDDETLFLGGAFVEDTCVLTRIGEGALKVEYFPGLAGGHIVESTLPGTPNESVFVMDVVETDDDDPA